MQLSQKHKIFAEEIIEGLSPELAYSKAYPKANATTCRVNGYRLLQNATIEAYVKEKSSKIEELATNKAVEELKDKIVSNYLTIEQRKALLSDIALGKALTKTYEVVISEDESEDGQPKYGTKPIAVVEPSAGDKIKAIATLNMMDGANATLKVEQKLVVKVPDEDDN